jgi:hypothetical protein
MLQQACTTVVGSDVNEPVLLPASLLWPFNCVLQTQVFDLGGGTLDLALLFVPANWSLAGKSVCRLHMCYVKSSLWTYSHV